VSLASGYPASAVAAIPSSVSTTILSPLHQFSTSLYYIYYPDLRPRSTYSTWKSDPDIITYSYSTLKS
jgi:hypothetical protein